MTEKQPGGVPSNYIDPRYAQGPNFVNMPQLAQATQDPNHPANPQHPKVSMNAKPFDIHNAVRAPMLITGYEPTAWRLGQEARREARERRHLRRRSDGGFGLGELDHLSRLRVPTGKRPADVCVCRLTTLISMQLVLAKWYLDCLGDISILVFLAM